MAKKSEIEVYYLDGETTVAFYGYMARSKFMERVGYLKENGFRFHKVDNTWTKTGDHAEQTKMDLDNLDAIRAAEKSHENAPKPEPKPEPEPKKHYSDKPLSEIIQHPELMALLCKDIVKYAPKSSIQIMMFVAFDALEAMDKQDK